jgi:hypothetical protein
MLLHSDASCVSVASFLCCDVKYGFVVQCYRECIIVSLIVIIVNLMTLLVLQGCLVPSQRQKDRSQNC